MTIRVCRTCGRGHWCSLFQETVRNTLIVLTVKNVKLNVQIHLNLDELTHSLFFFMGFDNKIEIDSFLEHFLEALG